MKVNKYYSKIVKRIIKYIKLNKYNLGNTLEYNDLAHEIITDLLSSKNPIDLRTGSIHGAEDSNAFLYITTINKCNKIFNKEKKYNNSLIQGVDVNNFVVEADNNLIVGTMAQKLLLDKLPENERTIWKLKMEGYTHKDIATKLQITSDASRKRMQRARSKLSNLLRNERQQSLL